MTLWILCGVPGSGKTYWAKHTKVPSCESPAYVSRDEIRFSLLKEGEDYFAHEKEVTKLFWKNIQDGLDNNNITDVIADATHLNEKSRLNLLNHLKLPKECKVNVVQFDIPLEECLERNAQREGRAFVPNGVIRRMFFSKTNPEEDSFNYNQIFKVW
jgi:predicted kinase